MIDETVAQELHNADKALAEHRYQAAMRLADAAEKAGAPVARTRALRRKAEAGMRTQAKSVAGSVRLGVCIAAIGYLILCARQPLGWGMPVWLALSFVVVPGIAGAFVGRKHAGERSAGLSFYDGARAGATAMCGYAVINLLVLGASMNFGNSDQGEAIVAGIVTVGVFSAVAGIVAGASSVVFSRVKSGGGEQ